MKPAVYSQTSIQLVFAVKHRDALITNNFKDFLHRYIGGILINNKHKPLCINSMPDHIHIFFGMYPCDLPALVRDIKSDTSKYINANKLSRFHFNWQDGYGFFSYSKSHRPSVIEYIEKQQEHHQKKTFKEEYLRILETNEIEFDPQYLFDFFD